MTANRLDRVGAETAPRRLPRLFSQSQAATVIERLCRDVLEGMARKAARKAVH